MIFKRIITNKLSGIWMTTSLGIILMLPLVIGVALYIKASPIISQNSLFQLITTNNWSPTNGNFGFMPFICSSLYVTFFAFIFASPVCLFSAIYLTQFASKKTTQIIRPAIDILAGIPSVIYGVWGILIVVPFVGDVLAPLLNIKSSGYSILSGGIVLSIMCIPYMLNMMIETLNTVPDGLKEATLSLGATQWETIKHVVLRKSMSGIISSFGLGITKAFGETLAVMMVVGNMVQTTINPFDSGYPLPALIANNYGEMLSIPMYDSALMFAALILLVVVLVINLIFRYFIHKTQRK